jgi:hypothetical protein
MSDAEAKLAQHIERIRRVAGLPKIVAPALARALELELVSTAERGLAPDGTPWIPTEDGRKPLRNVAANLTVRAIGTVVVAVLGAPDAAHHRGSVKGGKRRQVLPSSKLPSSIVRAFERVAGEGFHAVMGGR